MRALLLFYATARICRYFITLRRAVSITLLIYQALPTYASINLKKNKKTDHIVFRCQAIKRVKDMEGRGRRRVCEEKFLRLRPCQGTKWLLSKERGRPRG